MILQGEEKGKEDWGDPSLDVPADEDADQAPSFPELLPRISAAISALGGRGVFPKLNWSAPKVGRLVPACAGVLASFLGSVSYAIEEGAIEDRVIDEGKIKGGERASEEEDRAE